MCSGRQVENHVSGPTCMWSALCDVSELICVCLVFAAVKMWCSEFEFPRGQAAQYRRLEPAPGPQGQWRVMEPVPLRRSTATAPKSAKVRLLMESGPQDQWRVMFSVRLRWASSPPPEGAMGCKWTWT